MADAHNAEMATETAPRNLRVLTLLVELESCGSLCQFLIEHLAGPWELHRPINKRLHRRTERLPKLGEFVFHFRWKLRINCSLGRWTSIPLSDPRLMSTLKPLRQPTRRAGGGLVAHPSSGIEPKAPPAARESISMIFSQNAENESVF